ncbi:unnamed protein product [Cyclocybe aegerita]|uniref:Uncharacterized protein n=1 Tax=Cyclocybe aegerita TaxID=1973307 RepID=A0A8S0XQ93_CYCAE|nr:unnamed protein product [Cyclocybe aegerita]
MAHTTSIAVFPQNVSALKGGHVVLPSGLILSNAQTDSKEVIPSLCFLLTHSSFKRFVFDLSTWRNLKSYQPAVRKYFSSGLFIVSVSQDVVGLLAKGSLALDDIDTSTFVVGSACQSLFPEGKAYQDNPASSHTHNLLPVDQTRYLVVEEWGPIRPFPHMFNFYRDGSLYLVDSPGHLPGHLNVLAHMSADSVPSRQQCTHVSWKIITGDSEIKVGTPWDLHFCILDREKAEGHIANIWAL